jgi:hypothetical protein
VEKLRGPVAENTSKKHSRVFRNKIAVQDMMANKDSQVSLIVSSAASNLDFSLIKKVQHTCGSFASLGQITQSI